MFDNFTNLAYIAACVLFIFGIKKLNKPQTARQGNFFSALGLLIAVVAVFFENEVIASWNSSDWLQNGYLWCFIAVL
jgi:NAD/NADP transhydrogenase beta subunit